MYNDKAENKIALSIAVLTLNPEECLSDLLQTYAKLSTEDCELVIINQGSVPVARIAADTDIYTEIRPAEKLPAPAARNHAAEISRGDYIIFLDDHCNIFTDQTSFYDLLELLKKKQSDIVLLDKGKIADGEFVSTCPSRKPSKIGYIGVTRFAVEWNSVFKREFFLEHGGFINIGVGTEGAAQCGEILEIMFRLISKGAVIQQFSDVHISHPDFFIASKKKSLVYQYYYGHGFSAGFSGKYLAFHLRTAILSAFIVKYIILFIFPSLERCMEAIDEEYNNRYRRKTIYYVLLGFYHGISGKSPSRELRSALNSITDRSQ